MKKFNWLMVVIFVLVTGFASANAALLFWFPEAENLPVVSANFVWLFLISSFTVISILALAVVVMINLNKISFEKWKIETDREMITEKENASREEYRQNLERKQIMENYEKSMATAKYMLESHDCMKPETGYLDKEKMKIFNNIVRDHMNLFNQQNTPST